MNKKLNVLFHSLLIVSLFSSLSALNKLSKYSPPILICQCDGDSDADASGNDISADNGDFGPPGGNPLWKPFSK